MPQLLLGHAEAVGFEEKTPNTRFLPTIPQQNIYLGTIGGFGAELTRAKRPGPVKRTKIL